MLYILVIDDTADVFHVLDCAELFQLLNGGTLYAVNDTVDNDE